ncbi:ESPR-type extended signal peptide-containing protein, partial [Haemophilus sp. SZY H36]|uniref:ESPR-type extended signal peptide-containing protein n=1 Tax=Haemophilus sp. SZY H36 TaxID=2839968 RepID=UPI001C055661
MNHIYKVIWNTITQTWVAVSELSRAKGKTKSSKTLSAVVLAATSGILISGQAQSANEVGSAKDNSSVVFGIQSYASHDAVAVGGESNARAYEDVAIGYKATSGAELKIENGKEVTHSSNQSSVAVGTHAQATHVATTAIGAHAQAIHNFATAVGAGAIADHENASAFGEGAKAQGTYSTALGKGASATEDYAVALGKEASSTNTYSTSIGTKANATGQSSLAIGGAAIDSLPIRTNEEGKQYSKLEDGVGAKATGQDSAAIGASANATAKAALAVGKMANASANSTIAVGDQAQASGEKATSIGAGAIAKNDGTIAIGDRAKVGATNGNVAATNGIAIGTESESKDQQAIAVGKKAIAAGNNSIALGNETKTTGGEGVAIGNTANASHHSVAFGSQAKATADKGYSSAFGNQSEATAADASAFGNTAIAAAQDSTAIGAHSSVTSVATGGTALGRSSSVTTAGGVALGQGSSSSRTALDPNHVQINDKNIDKSTGISQDSEKISDVYSPVKLIDDPEVLKRVKNTIHGNAGAVSLGKDGETTRQLTNLAPGSADSDAVNVAQLKAVVGTIKHYNVTSKDGDITINPDTTDPNKTVWDLKINPKYKIKYFSVKSEGGANENNDGATGKDAIAIGKDAASSANNAVVIGKSATALKNDEQYDLNVGKAKSNADSAVVIGNGAISKQARTVAIGNAATTLHTSAIAIGDKAYSNGARGIAIGRNAQSTGNNSIALGAGDQNDGNKTEASKDHAVAIGSGAVANIADGIALGSKSETTAASGQTGFDASTHDGRANHYSGLNGKTLTSNLAGLSIGNGDKTRQINHLAAGTADDDAVNVAQLKSVNLAFKGDNNTKGDVRLHDQRLSVVGATDSFITTKASNNELEISTTQGTFSTTDGKSSSTTAGLATTTAVAKAINESGWEVRAKGNKVGLVNPGDKVDFTNADKSIEIESSAEANGLSTIKFKAVTETIQTEEKSPITQIDVNGSTVSKTTKGKNEPTGRFVVPTGDKANKYALATAYDVADKVNQTGWNLYTNGGARSLINPGDYVNFKSGNATNAKVVTEASEGATISYDVNVDNTTIKIDSNGNKLTANTGDVDSVTNTEGTSKKGQVTIHKDPLEPSKTDSGKLATVDTVVKAVNNAKWFTIAKDSDDKVTGETKTNESEGTAMAAGETLGLNAGKNLRLKREANTNNFTFALDSNLKDLDSVHTKEIKLGESNNPISIKNDGDRITYTTKGGNNSDVTHKVANLEDEKHIKPTTDGNEYTVDASGNITMTYADGNNKDVTNTKAVIKGVAKNDLSNITNDGKRAITTLGSVVKAGDNVLVDEDTDAVTGKKTYTVNAVTPVVYTDKQGNRVYKVKDGNGYKFTKNADGTGEVVNKSDVIASFYDGNNSTTAGTMIVNNIGSAIKNVTVPAGKDANNFLNKLEVAASATGTPNAAVNVSDLHNTADALRSNEIHIAPTTDKTEGKEATHYKYDADKKQVVMTYQDGKGKDVADKKAVIDLSSLADSVHNYGFKANATGNGSTGASAQDVANGTTVNFDAGKNLTVTQTVDGEKNHTYSFALSNNVDLTSAGSITMGDTKVDNSGITINAITPAAGETKKPDVTLTNTGLSNGDNHITNVKGNLPSTQNNTASGDNAQSNATKSKEAPNITGTGDNVVNVNNAATVGDVLNAGWNLQGNGSDIDFVKPYDTVNFANGTGTTATVTNMDGKTTTVKYDVAVGKGLEVDGDNKVTVKTDGDTITVGEDGKLKASLSTEKVKAATGDDNIATVTPSTTDTSKYGEKGATYEVAVTKSAVKQVAKTAVKVAAGDNVIVSSKDDATNNETTYTVEAVTPVVYTDKSGKKVYAVKQPDGSYKFYNKPNSTNSADEVNPSNVIASFLDSNNSTTAGAMIVNNIGSAIKNATVPAGKDANNFLNKLEVAASDTGTQNAAVNVSDLHNTADALRSNEIHIAPTTDKAEGKEATHYKYNATTKQVEMTYEDGKGNKVANKKAVIDLSSLADSVHN